MRFIINQAKIVKPDMLILLGDLVYHGPRNPLPEAYDTRVVLKEINELNALPCPITAVRGNCDADVDVDHLPFAVTDTAWIDCDGLRIFASHGHKLPEYPPLPAVIPAGTIVLRGHTHIPRGETLGQMHFWNPGSLSLPKNGWPGTYGQYENGTFCVFDTRGREVLRHRPTEA